MTTAEIQTKLAALGLYGGSIDGQSSPDLVESVKAFQRANGLADDGIVGPKTTAALNGGPVSAPAKPKPVPVTPAPAPPKAKPAPAAAKPQGHALKTSAAGRAAITQREGSKLHAYLDSVSVWTIGVGHTSAAGPPTVSRGLTITQAQCDEILSRDLATFEAVVNAVGADLNQHEFDACVSLAFNIGAGAFAKSTVARKLKEGDHKNAADAFLSWSRAGDDPNALLTRRKAERLQFLNRKE